MSIFKREDPETPKSVRYNAPRALTAAATTIKIGDKGEAEAFRKRRASATGSWQSEAWEYYDEIGEIKQAFTTISSVVSRIRLYSAVVEDPSATPSAIEDVEGMDPTLADAAKRALDRLDASFGGQSGLLRDATLNLSVAGECYLVQVPERIGTGLPETWDIRSVDELRVEKDDSYTIVARRDLAGINTGSVKKPINGITHLPTGAFVGRIWRTHPRYTEDADSSMRGLLALCEELLMINRTFRGMEKSRMNAGMIFVPDGISTAATADPETPQDDPDAAEAAGEQTLEEMADEFEENFIQAMITPIQDESSAAVVAPLIVRGPTELGEKISYKTFDRKFDETLGKRAEQVLDRILQGLDIPKDIITGLSNVKYSNSVQINESLFRAHIEPMVLVIADSLTKIYLRPYLISQGFDEVDVNRIVIWYDSSAVSTRNDRAADADSGFEKGVLSAAAWRRMHGFSDTDAPTATEIGINLLRNNSALSPELTQALLTAVAPELMEAVRAASQANNPAPIPGQVQQMLSGAPGQAQPALDGAPTPGVDSTQGAPVQPGEDAPPVPLAEPGNQTGADGATNAAN